LLADFPTPEDFGVEQEHDCSKVYVGGESAALKHFKVTN